MIKYMQPYVNIPGSRVQHLASHRDPWRWLTSSSGERYAVPRAACINSAYNRNRDDAKRTDDRDNRPLCKVCIRSWQWEQFSLLRRSMMMAEVLTGTG
jgi:hypothetical protein